jgi:hypothetical protein
MELRTEELKPPSETRVSSDRATQKTKMSACLCELLICLNMKRKLSILSAVFPRFFFRDIPDNSRINPAVNQPQDAVGRAADLPAVGCHD